MMKAILHVKLENGEAFTEECEFGITKVQIPEIPEQYFCDFFINHDLSESPIKEIIIKPQNLKRK